MPFYCATHKDEDLDALRGETLDAMTEHMVAYKAYNLEVVSNIGPQYVIWEMTKRPGELFRFSHIVERV